MSLTTNKIELTDVFVSVGYASKCEVRLTLLADVSGIAQARE